MSAGFTASELEQLQRIVTRRVQKEWFLSGHPEYKRVTSRVAALLDADRNASIAECPPPPVLEIGLTADQAAGMDDVAEFSSGQAASAACLRAQPEPSNASESYDT